MYLPESKAKFNEIYSYSPPELYENQDWYVGFYAFDPALGKLHFKKIKLNYIKKIGERRAFAKGLIKRLNSQLEKGWNPWIESTNSMAYQYLDDVCDHYRKYIKKLHEDGVYRKDTYVSNLSYINNLQLFNKKSKNKIKIKTFFNSLEKVTDYATK